MNTVTFKRVLQGAASKLGWHPYGDEISDGQREELANVLQGRIDQAVRFEWWPEWVETEERYYRPVWVVTTPYVLNDEVYYEDADAYYKCLVANTGEEPDDVGSTYWEELEDDDFDRYIEWEQTGLTPIGEVKGIYAKDPDTNDYPGELDKTLSALGIEPSSLAGNSVFMKFRRRPPQVTGTKYDKTKTYTAGTVVYDDTTGECYVCAAESTGDAVTDDDYWTKQNILDYWRQFLVLGAYADLVEGDGQEDNSVTPEEKAHDALMDAATTAMAGQGQTETVCVRVR